MFIYSNYKNGKLKDFSIIQKWKIISCVPLPQKAINFHISRSNTILNTVIHNMENY